MSVVERQIPDLIIAEGASIRDALQAIDTNGREMVMVSDKSDRIIGLISDGDIRRGLLAGLTLDLPAVNVMTRDFFTVAPDTDRASVLDIMRARSFPYVPVLDRDRRLIAVHFLRDLLGAAPKPNIAVVMAGGRGARLRPVTDAIPKPMIEVAGRPMLERIVLHLVGHGVQTIHLAVNFMADVIERHFGDGSTLGCRIEYLRESTPLGTGGALSLLTERPAHPFFVLNGDLISTAEWTGIPLKELLDEVTLQQGVVDGQENPLANIWASKLYEVQKYLTLTAHKFEMTPFLMSKRTWDRLSEGDRKIIQEAAAEATQLQRKLAAEADQKLEGELKAKGTRIDKIDNAVFAKATEPVTAKWTAGPIGDYVKKVVGAARGN